MRRLFIAIAFLSLSAAAFAQSMRGKNTAELRDELNAIVDKSAAEQLGTMTVGDVEKILGDISIAYQKAVYVQGARTASLRLPGLGQFRTGDKLGGSLWLAADVVLTAGTLVGGYFLLPANVQFNSLDYFNTPLSTIKSTWESNTVLEYLPTAGVLAGGMIVEALLRHFSSANAGNEAQRNIEEGKVTFSPEMFPLLEPTMGADGRMGMGMGMMMRWRY